MRNETASQQVTDAYSSAAWTLDWTLRFHDNTLKYISCCCPTSVLFDDVIS